jgi:hypothetical protein
MEAARIEIETRVTQSRMRVCTVASACYLLMLAM